MKNHKNSLFTVVLFVSTLLFGIACGMESNDKEKIIIEKILVRLKEADLRDPIPNPLCPVLETEDMVKTKCQGPVKPHKQNASTISIKSAPILERGGGKDRPGKSNYINISDDRKRVLVTSDFPHSAHGVLLMKFRNFTSENGYAFGSGTLISPYLVLTAAHNIYNKENYHDDQKVIGEVEEAWFIPGMNDKNTPFGKIKVKKWYYPDQYKKIYSNSCDDTEDYALLVLNQPVGEKTGYFGIQIAPRNHLEKLKITVTGYPSSYPSQEPPKKPDEYQMWNMQGNVKVVNENYIAYDSYTMDGNSGGGVWSEEGEDYFVWGIHVLKDTIGVICKGLNAATLITKARFANLKKWAEESILDRLKEGIGDFEGIMELNLNSQFIEDFGIKKLFEYNLPHLTSLDLRRNEIRDEGTQYISQWLANNTVLIKFDMGKNKISNLGAQLIGRSLAENTSLTKLSLRANRIGDTGVESIVQGLSKNTTLTELDLGGNNIRNVGAQHLTQWLEKNGTITILGLEYNRIDRAILSGINVLIIRNKITKNDPTLIALNCCNSQLGSRETSQKVGQWLNRNSTLIDLDLSNNQISDEGVESIVQGLINNTTLILLNLSNNEISTKGAQCVVQWLEKNFTITTLNLEYNQIDKAILNTINVLLIRNRLMKNDPRLTMLDLYDSQIGNDEEQWIAQGLEKNTNLTKLDLRKDKIDNQILGTINGFIFRNKLMKDPRLTELAAISSYINDNGAQSIGQGLTENIALTKLDLGYNQIGDEGVKFIVQNLSKNNTLIELNLGNNDISNTGAQFLIQWLEENTTLTTLYLRDNKIEDDLILSKLYALLLRNQLMKNMPIKGTGATVMGLSFLDGELVPNYGKLRFKLISLDRVYNSIYDILGIKRDICFGIKGAQWIGQGLAKNNTLTYLDLQSNYITDWGIKLIIQGLAQNTSLDSLNLNCNFINHEGAQLIGQWLTNRAMFTTLYLGRNKIGDEGVRFIMQGLTKNNTLTQLDLQRNQISNVGIRLLVQGLANNTTLKELYLGGNQVGNEGAQDIGQWLAKNSTLTNLILCCSQIGDEGAEAIFQRLGKNTTLTHLTLSCNQITDKGALQIAPWLVDNTTLAELDLSGNKISETRELVIRNSANQSLKRINFDVEGHIIR